MELDSFFESVVIMSHSLRLSFLKWLSWTIASLLSLSDNFLAFALLYVVLKNVIVFSRRGNNTLFILVSSMLVHFL